MKSVRALPPGLARTQHPTPHPPHWVPSHLGGGQLQVANRFRVRKELDLLHQTGPAVPTHHSLVQGPCGCGDRALNSPPLTHTPLFPLHDPRWPLSCHKGLSEVPCPLDTDMPDRFPLCHEDGTPLGTQLSTISVDTGPWSVERFCGKSHHQPPSLHQVLLLKGIPGDCPLTGCANPSTPTPKLDWVSNRITSDVTESVSFLSPGTPQGQAFCLCIPYIGIYGAL